MSIPLMTWDIAFDEAFSGVHVTVTGIFSAVAFAQLSEDVLSSPLWRPGTSALFDYRDCDVNREFHEIYAAAATSSALSERIGDGKIATVVSSKAAFGSARQYQNLVASEMKAIIRVFDEIDAAKAWLNEGRRSSE